MATVGYATLQVIPSFRGFAGALITETSSGATDAARRVEGELTKAGDSAGRSIGQRVTAGLDRVRSAVGGIAGDLAGVGVVAAGISGTIAANANKAQIQAALGIGPDEAAAAAKVSGTLYAQGWGDSLEQVSGAVVIVKQQLAGLAGGDDLSGLTQRAQTLEKVFGIDLTESVRTAGKMVKTGLVPDVQSAFDALTVGAQRGLDASGDLTATFDEYSLFFKQLGVDAPTALGLMSQAADAGAFNIDKVGDALKEFNLRAVDLGDAGAQEAFKELGLSGKVMARDVAGGGEKANAALQKVLDRLRGVKDPAEQATLAMALFGGPGEDLAGALYALDPASAAAAQGFDKVTGASGQAASALAGGMSPVEQFTRSFQQTLTVLAAEAMPVLQPIFDWLQQAGPAVARVAIAFVALVAVNKAVGAVKAVAGGIRDTASAARTAASAAATAGRAIGTAGAASGRAAAGAARWAAAQTSSAAASTRAAASAVASRVATTASAVASRTAAVATAAWNAVVNSSAVAHARAGVALVASRVAMIAGTVATGAATAATWLLNAAMAVLTSPITAVVVAIALLVAGIIWAWRNVDWFRDGVLAAWQWIQNAVTAAVDVVRAVISTVWGWISAYITTAVAGWRMVISTAWSFISTAVSTYINLVRSVISTVVGWISAWWRASVTGWRIVISTVWAAIVAVVQAGIARVRAIIAGISAVVGVIRSAFASARDAAVGRLESLLSFVRGLTGKITGALGGLKDKLVAIGRNVVQGLRDGISGAWHLVTSKVQELVNRIPAKIREMLGISSPSKVARRLFYHVGEGAALGVGDGQGLVERAAGRLARAAAIAPLGAGVVPVFAAGMPSYSESTTYQLYGTTDELWARVQAAQAEHRARQRLRRPY
ncbi:phage tail tape measure protein [Micromonospora craniellae]|uniref:Phage tail tape measure protein domain-containing protein n=1 Tax=Micromonospora craniellae TaxID=2294034 RepID=A0A372G257_9ACTN|nr:phage tail tape measure protein [Micromonospora craniellae]QOC89883.1 phage tail tape measure protein [Micromonospora craniellae]RFS47028.1 hypothetical protein D0Q02_07655 [Micromonospora craniellae]